MPSLCGWVDFAEEDRRKMLDVVHLFKDRETRDELGLGTIRDAIANHFFPGTSTIQTRARYFLIIPWIYMELERKKIQSSKIAEKARSQEVYMINALLDNGESEGVIGREANL